MVELIQQHNRFRHLHTYTKQFEYSELILKFFYLVTDSVQILIHVIIDDILLFREMAAIREATLSAAGDGPFGGPPTDADIKDRTKVKGEHIYNINRQHVTHCAEHPLSQ